MSSKPLYLKPRGAAALVPWEEIAVDAPEVTGQTLLEDAQFVALDIETTGNAPFLVLEIGAERFRLSGPLSFFDTLVDCRAPINPYARKRHHIDRSMLIGAPEFKDARRAFLRFALGAVLVEHSHDAFDTWLVGRGLESPLEHPIIDTTALARLVLDLPKGQTPGLARLVAELGVDETPAHAALDDARATAKVFRALIARARSTLGWTVVADVLAALPRPVVDRLPVATLGQSLQHRAIRAEGLNQALGLVGGERADGAQPHRAQPFLGLGAETWNHADRQRGQEVGLGARRYEDQAIRLSCAARHLGHQLGGRGAHRSRQTDLGVDLELDPASHVLRGRGAVPGPRRHVEVRLVQGDPLDELRRGEAAKDLVDEPARLSVAGAVRRDHRQLGRELQRLMERHRRAHAIGPGLV